MIWPWYIFTLLRNFFNNFNQFMTYELWIISENKMAIHASNFNLKKGIWPLFWIVFQHPVRTRRIGILKLLKELSILINRISD
mmetsp:Transcript_26009/g.4457  ORF Transcript_26009/g.4457 Transcript_26009/m.4457 type:complete len:83 (+) Transcript_26009:317-565(+)